MMQGRDMSRRGVPGKNFVEKPVWQYVDEIVRQRYAKDPKPVEYETIEAGITDALKESPLKIHPHIVRRGIVLAEHKKRIREVLPEGGRFVGYVPFDA
ncbi:MAG: hypothetical protein HYS81_01585 [Candidatus Aenigmatarchaeota archaeon]|nr:MAG: hypothetical protein HYS81_01585 [Candidatus Aenigmarchaeota archaeon]